MSVGYMVVVHLVPQDATLSEWLYVAREAFEKRQSIQFSADDAKRLVADGQPGSKVIVWNPQRWTGGDIQKWLLPAACEVRYFPVPLSTYIPELKPLTVAVYPMYEGYKQHNQHAGHVVSEHFRDFLTVIRQQTSQPVEDAKRGWPL